MKYNISGHEYDYTINVRDNEHARASFNRLAEETFGLQFESWYQNGYWGDSYVPHALLDGDAVVSNISVNVIDTTWNGQKKRYVQLGTVMTAASHRQQGLSSWLMNRVLSEWSDKCDAIYLFANDSVIDYYPRFGFERATEYQYTMEIHHQEAAVRKLDMSAAEDVSLLLNTYKLSNPYSALPLENSAGLLMFYCSQYMREHIYYVEPYEAVVVAEHDGERVICYDIFSGGNGRLEDLLRAIATDHTKTAVLGFTPKQASNFSVEEWHEEGTTLFLLRGKENLFNSNKLMFPLLSHA
ncbi:GNAT family N-acetyltransferase [Paenibacillus marinisediminis]